MADKTYTRTIPKKQPTTITTPEGTPDRIKAARERCKARGGVWDEATRTCEVERKPVGAGGSITTEAERQAVGQVGDTERELARVRSTGLPSAAERIVQKEEEFKQTQAVEAEKERLEEEESPIRPILDPIVDAGLGGDPEAIGGELFPILGPLGTFAKREGFINAFPIIAEMLKMKGVEESEDFTKGLTEQQLIEIGLTELQLAPLKERELSSSENFGQFVEALSLGDLSNFAAEKPSENIQMIIKSLRTLKTEATDADMKVRRGAWSREKGYQEIEDIENDLNQGIYDLKMLIQNSPEYKFNSDGVNYIEGKAYQAQKLLYDVKLSMAEGKTEDPTVFQIITDLQQQIATEEYVF